MQKQHHEILSGSIAGKLYQIIEALKKAEKPVDAQYIKDQTSIDLNVEKEVAMNVEKNVKIVVQNNLYAYKPAFNIKSKDDLENVIKQYSDTLQGGLHVKELKDSWSGNLFFDTVLFFLFERFYKLVLYSVSFFILFL